MLHKQYIIYDQLIQQIIFIGKNNFLFEQNKEKIKVCEDIIQNLKDNIYFVDQAISSNNEYIKSNAISLKIEKIETKNEDIKKYFQDFGLFNTFILQLNDGYNGNCNIF